MRLYFPVDLATPWYKSRPSSADRPTLPRVQVAMPPLAHTEEPLVESLVCGAALPLPFINSSAPGCLSAHHPFCTWLYGRPRFGNAAGTGSMGHPLRNTLVEAQTHTKKPPPFQEAAFSTKTTDSTTAGSPPSRFAGSRRLAPAGCTCPQAGWTRPARPPGPRPAPAALGGPRRRRA